MTSTLIPTFTEANFASDVLQSPIPVAVLFNADWCVPCKMLEPIIQDVAEEYNGRLKFGQINIETDPGVAAKYNVTFVPTVLFFKGGEVAGKVAGLRPRKEFLSSLAPLAG